MTYDRIILGAGLYGLYAALFCARQGERVAVLERDATPFRRATYINQARVHMGYHYPRSISTAVKSRGYFERFVADYGFCIHDTFDQLYATSSRFSWTDAAAFRKFCQDADIRCDDVVPANYFKEGLCDGAYMTTEYTYDAALLRDYFMEQLGAFPKVTLQFDARVCAVTRRDDVYEMSLQGGETLSSGFVLNATYAGINQIHKLLDIPPLPIKYELCEIILCQTGEVLRHTGITVMDGPFFSIMPFGKTGFHSLTSVTFTPHVTSYDSVPTFPCQEKAVDCTPACLGNCNDCPAKPESAWPYMSSLARKYLRDNYDFSYHGSLFSMKPILKTSEIDDSRPTVIRRYSENPTFVSVLSGKINTVYDLDEVLQHG